MPLRNLDVEVPVVPINPPTVGRGGYTGLNPRTETLPRGWKFDHPDAKPIDSDITVDHDVAVRMRDGTTLYADIYRPPSSSAGDKVPAIVCWSPFGKQFNGILSLGLMVPWDLGIPKGTLSGLEKFEGPDPAEWVPRGYAIVNIDARGAFDSEGTMVIMGTQEAEDCYDSIEACAKMPWCNGKVGMAGNSHLAIIQWFVAALRPPSLAAIAPWEGCGDLYREQFARGGIYGGDLFDKLIVKYMLQGRSGIESFGDMFKKHPLANAWWNDKRPDMKKINIPTYITGTWTNTMHGMGAIRGWLEVDTPDKWMRWHPWQEWYDLWGNNQAREELLQFFDYFLLDKKNNGWNTVPRLRMATLRFGKKEPQSYENIVEDEFPPARTQYKKFYLAPEGKVSVEQPLQGPSHIASYNSETADRLDFVHTFSETTTIMGIPKAVLYMSCPDYDDMDVYVTVEKLDKKGKQMTNLNIPWSGIPVNSFEEMKPEQMTEVVTYKGPMGIMRASLRAIDESKSMHPHWPYYPQDKAEKITPGTIVRLDIGIWATGIEFEAGESVRIVVCGRGLGVNNFGSLEHLDNKGIHQLHLGGEHGSHVILPFV
ncbi:X-Pro dipeptidyl-peptidase C-terminal non-catalytic domain-containing protein [Microdochium trichocladiopsis]|uniref:X-Pro dipeptidyl-peptidase C-terminal non-catalytic domain-containing protein n=1 Tax=Microdochium trichocladiopsis TaxID=1682393 RepID=A0A9P8YCX8_9PEZI|nr:X-Pro dipeptidyl-peptidase C-terminal non-catalytic domain-containing protein [Microdochium trichocladiopsis]KAH7037023.1 X-Pro dipeptidyl-peptidase C-terminal non-catalytic domain-containing protein [Microdochium trichocladiopsis]